MLVVNIDDMCVDLIMFVQISGGLKAVPRKRIVNMFSQGQPGCTLL